MITLALLRYGFDSSSVQCVEELFSNGIKNLEKKINKDLKDKGMHIASKRFNEQDYDYVDIEIYVSSNQVPFSTEIIPVVRGYRQQYDSYYAKDMDIMYRDYSDSDSLYNSRSSSIYHRPSQKVDLKEKYELIHRAKDRGILIVETEINWSGKKAKKYYHEYWHILSKDNTLNSFVDGTRSRIIGLHDTNMIFHSGFNEPFFDDFSIKGENNKIGISYSDIC